MKPKHYATVNTCSMCKPLGAVLALKGIAGAMPLVHGSQGCATYMRLFLVRHFREPIDIASSALNEKDAVYGGEGNLKSAIKNVVDRYKPEVIGIVTGCLAETIGDYVERIVEECRGSLPNVDLVVTHAPGFAGDWSEGYHAAVRDIIGQLVKRARSTQAINLLPGITAPADIRYLKALFADSDSWPVVIPDISETMDGPLNLNPTPIPAGGARLEHIAAMDGAAATIELGSASGTESGGAYLKERFGVPHLRVNRPVGLQATDLFFKTLLELGVKVDHRHTEPRGRLLDAMADAHRILFGVRTVIFGESDLVAAVANFCFELGMEPVLLAGAAASLKKVCESSAKMFDWPYLPEILADADFERIKKRLEGEQIDLLIGDSNGRHLAEALDIPLLRVGFPVYDRFGAGRITTLGYEAAIKLTDEIANLLLEKREAGKISIYERGV